MMTTSALGATLDPGHHRSLRDSCRRPRRRRPRRHRLALSLGDMDLADGPFLDGHTHMDDGADPDREEELHGYSEADR